MAPTRGLLICPATIGRYSLSPDTPVWILASHEDSWEVEYRDASGRVARSGVVECPVPRPPLVQLRELDACFGLAEAAFDDVHADPKNCFVIQRCRAHGTLFLRDTRCTVALYERVTLLGPDDGGSWVELWRRYHGMSDDWLNLKGRTW